jgi:capsular polysaccharide export protein
MPAAAELSSQPAWADEPAITAFLGVAGWKRRSVSRLFADADEPASFHQLASRAVAKARGRHGAVGVWTSRAPKALEPLARQADVPLVRLEDGFLRSNGLGAECRAPLSLVADRTGIYFDPRTPSDLEHILTGARFGHALVARAERLVGRIVAQGLTKYNLTGRGAPPARGSRRLVLVAGQVEDDLSVRLGGAGVTSNLMLLARARRMEPDAVIVYRPHPDVEAGHRKGGYGRSQILRFADAVAQDTPLAALLEAVDAVHVLTSLTGFEALLRGREVITHGQPFYAGWGLTRDLAPPPRRGRPLSLAELAAGALILYPRYLDPVTDRPCTPEVAVQRLAEGAGASPGVLPAFRRMQGCVRRVLISAGAA